MITQKVRILGFFITILISSCSAQHPITAPVHESLSDSAPVVRGTRISGKLENPKSGWIYLWSMYGNETNRIDSARIVRGEFSFAPNPMPTGVYMLGLTDQNMCPIIIQEGDSICKIGFGNGRMESNATVIQSKSNEGWFDFLAREQWLKKNVQQAQRALHYANGPKAHFEERLRDREVELRQFQDSTALAYPNTFMAQMIQWSQVPLNTDSQHYWDNIDFNDERLMRCKVMPDRIQQYMRSYSEGKESGFIRCVDEIAQRAKVNDQVLEFVLIQMLTGFYDSGMENICAYIMDQYIHGESCGDADLTSVIQNLAENIHQLAVGQVPPNIQLTGMDGQPVNLYDIATKHAFTLVMFWSSWCEHCKTEAPSVVKLYADQHRKGLEIVGVSIDNSETTWRSAVDQRGFTFPNVCGMNLFQSAVAKDYRLSKTPTYFLLNEKKEIVLKPKSISEVSKYLASHSRQ